MPLSRDGEDAEDCGMGILHCPAGPGLMAMPPETSRLEMEEWFLPDVFLSRASMRLVFWHSELLFFFQIISGFHIRSYLMIETQNFFLSGNVNIWGNSCSSSFPPLLSICNAYFYIKNSHFSLKSQPFQQKHLFLVPAKCTTTFPTASLSNSNPHSGNNNKNDLELWC